MIVPTYVSGLRRSCGGQIQKTFHQIPKQITPELDIGKSRPEICRIGKFFVSYSRLFEMRYLSAIN